MRKEHVRESDTDMSIAWGTRIPSNLELLRLDEGVTKSTNVGVSSAQTENDDKTLMSPFQEVQVFQELQDCDHQSSDSM